LGLGSDGPTPSSLPYMARTMSGTILSTATRAMSSMSEDATPSTKNNDYQVLREYCRLDHAIYYCLRLAH